MPPLPDLAPVMAPSLIPEIRLSQSSSPKNGKASKSKAPARHPPRRQYNNDPLPVKLNSVAPKSARIVGREQDYEGAFVTYQLKIGDVDMNVGVDEILDYVSPLDLEQFEMSRFREEIEILKVLEEDREVARRERLAKAAEKARTKGAVFVQEASDSDDSPEVQLGKHGRARPDYSKFYKKPGGKGKAIFDDLVDEQRGEGVTPMDEEEVPAPRPGSARTSGPLQQLPKKRRRRRDPLTGELIPLAPIPQPKLRIVPEVRRRRKRHPLTGELMPVGWHYDPEVEGNAYDNRRTGLGSAMKETALSISEQHEVKRPRLDTEGANSSSGSPVPTKAEIMAQASYQHRSPVKGGMKPIVVDLMSSDDEAAAGLTYHGSKVKSPPEQAGNSMIKGTITSATTTSVEESSPEPPPPLSIERQTAMSPPASQRTPRAQQPVTSILSPSAARASSTDLLALASEQDSSDEEDDEDEWLIEAILDHRMSDPKSHPAELGKQSVMLYSVKWAGYEAPTWEPVESFGDRSFVDVYRKKMGLKALPKEDDTEDEAENTVVGHRPPTDVKPAITTTADDDNADDSGGDDVEYEIERILAHHLSDPRTHPPALGKTPVMLYQIKWKGFEETTWEPEASFDDDVNFLRAYKKRHGLR